MCRKVTIKQYLHAAGQIVRLSSNKQGRQSVIVDRIGYDKEGHTVYTKLGNGTETTNTYDKQRERLQAMNLTADGQTVMENRYRYDAVDNILGITNAANPTSLTKLNKAKLGGRSSHTYEYDELNRLVHANGKAKRASYDMVIWIQTPRPNTTPDTNPGPPVSWNDPSNPDDPQAGYGYIPNDTTKEETFFYHSDHLGSTSYITDEHANITQYDAYLPYGELLVDEHSSSEDLPYKFNGKQFDEETGLYYYGARYLNPMASIWYGVDRFKEKYPHLSGFNACASNPLFFRDLNGDSLWIVNKQTNILYEDHKLYNKDGSLYSGEIKGFLKEAKEAIDIISGTDSGSNVLEEFQKSEKNIFIHKIYKENHFTASSTTRASLLMVPSNSKYSSIAGSGGDIYWDPYKTEGGPDEFRNTERPAFIGLAHEMGHAYAALKGKADYNYFSPKAMPPLNRIHRDEYDAMHFENMIRYELGYPLRIAYTYDDKGDLFFNYNYENRQLILWFKTINSRSNIKLHIGMYKSLGYNLAKLYKSLYTYRRFVYQKR